MLEQVAEQIWIHLQGIRVRRGSQPMSWFQPSGAPATELCDNKLTNTCRVKSPDWAARLHPPLQPQPQARFSLTLPCLHCLSAG